MHMFSNSVVSSHLSSENLKSQPEKKKHDARRRKRRGIRVTCPVYDGTFLHFSVWRRSHDLTLSFPPILLSFIHDHILTFIFAIP